MEGKYLFKMDGLAYATDEATRGNGYTWDRYYRAGWTEDEIIGYAARMADSLSKPGVMGIMTESMMNGWELNPILKKALVIYGQNSLDKMEEARQRAQEQRAARREYLYEKVAGEICEITGHKGAHTPSGIQLAAKAANQPVRSYQLYSRVLGYMQQKGEVQAAWTEQGSEYITYITLKGEERTRRTGYNCKNMFKFIK